VVPEEGERISYTFNTHTADISVQGDNIDEAKPLRLLWNIIASAEQFLTSYPLKADILTCDDKYPPYRRTTSVRRGPGIKSKNQIDISNLEIFRGADGKLYRRIEFWIEMTVIGTALEFALMYQDKKIGHSHVEPELDHGY
jgi:hypothetical protein